MNHLATVYEIFLKLLNNALLQEYYMICDAKYFRNLKRVARKWISSSIRLMNEISISESLMGVSENLNIRLKSF